VTQATLRLPGHPTCGSATRARRALLLASLVLLVAASAPAQQFKMARVELDYDKDADFKAFKTYSWKDTGQVAEDPAMHARIVWYVERELENKGLKKSADGAGELLVRYYARKREALQGTAKDSVTTLPGGAGQHTTSVDIAKVTEGTLLVELQRASDQKAVWTASTEYRSLDKQKIDAETKAAVRQLIAKYPPPLP
jgi:hypothetical protein